MSELADSLREGVAQLAARDPALRRFGAEAHAYALLPPLSEDELAAVEARLGTALPEDVREVAREVGRGGAGPGYGWLPLDRAAPYALPSGERVLPLAHLGCGHIAALEPASGAVWIDARGARVCRPVEDSFTVWYAGWLARVLTGAWPSAYVDGRACALPAALTGYLAACEQQLGLAAGTIAGAALRDALVALGPGAIAIAADGPPELFDAGDLADPCLRCAQLVENLAADGLSPAAVAPGVRPRPVR